MFIHFLSHLHWIPSHEHLDMHLFCSMDTLELIGMVLLLKSMLQDFPSIWFFVLQSSLELVVAIPHNWCYVDHLKSWNRCYYHAWNSMSLICTSSKLNIHSYLVCTLTVLKMLLTFQWFRLWSRFTSYYNCFWHHRSIYCLSKTMISIYGIPFTVLGILGVNSLDNLVLICTTFVCTMVQNLVLQKMVLLYSHWENYISLAYFVQIVLHPKKFPTSFLL
jgi:hypothetical protein